MVDDPTMIAMMLALLLVPALGIAAMVMTARIADRRAAAAGLRVPAGFGGWLLPVVVGQTVAPLGVAIASVRIARDYAQMSAAYPRGWVVGAVDGMCNAVLFGLACWSAVALWRRQRVFIRLFTVQWVFGIATLAGGLALALWVTEMPAAVAFGGDLGAIWTLVGRLGGMGLWVWYLHASERVANTFTG